MQLTRFDRWLREKFVYTTHIYTMRPPAKLPRGVKKRRYQAPEGSRYQFLYVPQSQQAERALIATLNAGGQLFTTQIVESKSWFARMIAPEGKSLTWTLFSTCLFLCGMIATIMLCHHLWQNPEIRENLVEAIEILKR
ncbi:MAG: hypothetical protein QM680_12275 [Luteolibacter sp.]